MAIQIFSGCNHYLIDSQLLGMAELDIDIHDPSGTAGIVRFIDLFNKVWCAIPIDDQYIIRKHIRGGAIILTENGSDSGLCCKHNADGCRSWGVATYHNNRMGQDFHFWMPFLNALPDGHACILIALALAHAFCHASPENGACIYHHFDLSQENDEKRNFVLEKAEVEAGDCADDWGFDYCVLLDYFCDHADELPKPYNPYKFVSVMGYADWDHDLFRVSTDW